MRRADILSTTQVVIVDDNQNHCHGIRQLLELQSPVEVAGVYQSASEAIRQLAKAEASIVLIDMSMPDMDGVSAIQQIVAQHPDIKILAITGYDDPDLIFRAMRAGAKGYILKTMITAQLITAIEEVALGKVYLPPTLATKFFDEFQSKMGPSNRTEETRKALLTYLTNREKEVLTLLTEGITYKGVADKLVISETTVKTHVNNIFQKLQVNDRTQAVLYALKYGLVETASSLATA
jgi:DNA-binding NarL/FixJ family response regulator